MSQHRISPDAFQTLTEMLDQRASGKHTLTYVAHDGSETTWAYADIRERALALLAGLQQEHGLKAGDPLVFFLEDNLAFIEAFWACLYGGVIAVPVSSGPTTEHLNKLLKVSQQFQQATVYTHDALAERLTAHAEKTDSKAPHVLTLEQVARGDSKAATITQVKGDDLAFIQFSSGSTSDPKGVVLTHRNLIINSAAIANGGLYRDDDITFSWMPLTHDMGLIGFHITPMLRGVSQINMRAETFSRQPHLWLDKVSEHRASVLCSPNFGFKHYLKRLDSEPTHLDLSCVRVIYNGAEPISVPLCQEFLQRMGQHGLKDTSMFTVYGLAEATLAATFPEAETPFTWLSVDRQQLKPDDTVALLDDNDANALHFVCVGSAVDDIEVNIQDDKGEPLDERRIGSICIQGPTVTSGYFNNDAANAAAFQNGWFNTGDLGFMHQGQLYITGRAKDIIFSNGLNYYPHDLEDLSGLELGKMVFVGVREGDDAVEDSIIGFVHVKKDQMEDLKAFSEQASAIRRRVNEASGLSVDAILPTPVVPRTTSGKVQRARLGQAYLNGDFSHIEQQLAQLNNASSETSDDGNALENEVKAICDEVIEETKLSLDDNFFDSGISSLSLAQVHEEIDERYPDKLEITDFFDHPSIREVAAYLQSQLEN
ncbi:amino acid adenylation [gamma proteobacterium HTCC5015]|nr:amino acid adenylation [gamma proteobacterium HTCC5015]